MGLWAKGMKRAEEGTSTIESAVEIIDDFLEGQSQIAGRTIVDPEKRIVDIEGSVEIHQRDLENGELPFKIRKLTGDIILVGTGLYNKSILPDELGGNIISSVQHKD